MTGDTLSWREVLRQGLLNQLHQFTRLPPKFAVIGTNIGQIATGIVLLPKLGGKILTKIGERLESGFLVDNRVKKRGQVVNSLQRPTFPDKESLQIAFDGFLEKFNCTVAGATRDEKRIDRVQALLRQQEPVRRICFIRLHTKRSPNRTISA